jgi:hypothetical protein
VRTLRVAGHPNVEFSSAVRNGTLVVGSWTASYLAEAASSYIVCRDEEPDTGVSDDPCIFHVKSGFIVYNSWRSPSYGECPILSILSTMILQFIEITHHTSPITSYVPSPSSVQCVLSHQSWLRVVTTSLFHLNSCWILLEQSN